MTDVVAALIFDRNGRFLIAQRPKHKARGSLFEFVGGKVEPGEKREEALVRECREELDADITVDRLFAEIDHAYPDLTIHLSVFVCHLNNDHIEMREHQQLCFISPDEIDNYTFCPADIEILSAIKEKF